MEQIQVNQQEPLTGFGNGELLTTTMNAEESQSSNNMDQVIPNPDVVLDENVDMNLHFSDHHQGECPEHTQDYTLNINKNDLNLLMENMKGAVVKITYIFPNDKSTVVEGAENTVVENSKDKSKKESDDGAESESDTESNSETDSDSDSESDNDSDDTESTGCDDVSDSEQSYSDRCVSEYRENISYTFRIDNNNLLIIALMLLGSMYINTFATH